MAAGGVKWNEEIRMPKARDLAVPTSLHDLANIFRDVEGFPPLLAALEQGHGATIDGAWGSSAALAAATLGLAAPRTLLVVVAHPRDIDGWVEDIATFTGVRPVIFPAWENLPSVDTVIDELATQRLRLLKQLQAATPPRILVTTMQALIQPVPDRAQLEQGRQVLRVGARTDMDQVAAWLVEHGYQRTDAVELPGEFSRRGGILDIFSPDVDAPYRLEFFGDEVESIRQFAPQTQRSLGTLQTAEISAANVERLAPATESDNGDGNAGIVLRGHLCDYLSAEAWTLLVEPEELQEQGKLYLERVADLRGLFSVPGVFSQLLRFPSIQVSALPRPSVEATCHLRVESVERFSGNVSRVRDELDGIAQAGANGDHTGDRVLIACHNEAEVKRLGEVLAAGQLAQSDRLRLLTGSVRAGFRMVDAGIVVLGGQELFHRDPHPSPGGESKVAGPRRRLESRAIDSFLDLNDGDLVVHVSHGIARYLGMQVLEKNGQTEEHLLLEFRDGVYVYVPASKIDLVQKYVGGSKTDPELSKVGGTGWQRKKEKVQAAVLDLASEMVELQALREAKPGIALPPDTEWQAEFEAAFPFQETPDQLASLAEIKRDLQRARPMDRLICGDVGYGKTEVAIRGAFKAIDNGKQVAVLVPTTVLAEQHFRTFSQRLAEYPFVVECLSRFRTGREQREIVERLGRGGVDVIIGTHRLVSADVRFKDLGLVIIDEEQRFGVEHKERLKRLRQTVDVLTMTATPIPRTLHLALLGIRDISNLETAPADRLAIETRITRFDRQLIRHAILRELNRDGQVYFVHNRVYNIEAVAQELREIVPEARFSVAHGQMPEHDLEDAMLRFVRRESDVLVATTIIESGLDIPNANTIFINQADLYGLADLHQLRGRVGRYKHRAYAYLLLDSDRSVTPNAARRLKAIEEFTELGAGFKIALRDLEIRGAGNILGTQQSGHIAAVGYEMYCQLLENAVRSLRNQRLKTPLEVTIDLPWEAYLPRDYVPGQRLRIEVYRRLARVRRLERLADFRQELRDRFGPLPEPAEWLLRLAEVRLLAARWQVAQVRLEKPPPNSMGPTDLVLQYRSARQIKRVAQQSNDRLRIVDDHSAYFRLSASEMEPEALYECLGQLLAVPEESAESLASNS
jgi:transcription-repair coupling factor (superfamily II helicase)